MIRRLALVLALSVTAGAVAVISRRPGDRPPPDPNPVCQVVDQPDWAEVEVMVLRTFAKRHIAQEAAAGRRSLVEAAALFGQLNRLPPVGRLPDYPHLSGDTEEERLCRQVIVFVTRSGPDWNSESVRATAARLEVELRQELARDGIVRLPDPAGLPAAADLLEEARARLTEAERKAFLPARPADPPAD
jgi:hypothetical protein